MTFLRSTRSFLAPEAVSLKTPTIVDRRPQRHDVAGVLHHRQAGGLQLALERAHALLVAFALRTTGLNVSDAGQGACGDRRRQRSREDETRRVGADRIADVALSGNVAAHDAEALRKCAVDDVNAVDDPVALGQTTAARPVEADRVHLVEVGESAVL